MNEKQGIHFPNFDAIRTIAVYFVLLAHLSYLHESLMQADYLKYNFLILRFIRHGDVGVALFFCLSGFLITYLLIEEIKIRKKISIGNFYMRRVLRIWPLYYLIILIAYFIIPIFSHNIGNVILNSHNIFYYMLFLGNIELISHYVNQTETSPIISPLWSISVEEQFYLLWPVLFLLNTRTRLYILGLLFGGCLYYRLTTQQGVWIVYYSSFGSFLFLTSGALLAHLVYYNFNKLKEMITRKVALSAYLILGCLFVYVMLTNRAADTDFIFRDFILVVFFVGC